MEFKLISCQLLVGVKEHHNYNWRSVDIFHQIGGRYPLNVIFRNQSTGFILTNGSIFITRDGGDNWTLSSDYRDLPRINNGERWQFCDFSILSRTGEIYLTAAKRCSRKVDSLCIFFSTTDDRRWKKIYEFKKFVNYDHQVSFLNKEHGCIIMGEQRLAFTSNAGKSWDIRKLDFFPWYINRGDNNRWLISDCWGEVIEVGITGTITKRMNCFYEGVRYIDDRFVMTKHQLLLRRHEKKYDEILCFPFNGNIGISYMFPINLGDKIFLIITEVI